MLAVHLCVTTPFVYTLSLEGPDIDSVPPTLVSRCSLCSDPKFPKLLTSSAPTSALSCDPPDQFLSFVLLLSCSPILTSLICCHEHHLRFLASLSLCSWCAIMHAHSHLPCVLSLLVSLPPFPLVRLTSLTSPKPCTCVFVCLCVCLALVFSLVVVGFPVPAIWFPPSSIPWEHLPVQQGLELEL